MNWLKCNNDGWCEDSFWNQEPKGRGLLIIALPYREGNHEAKSPLHFLPIIEHLEKIHAKNFVHGDIRAFNTVFGENEKHAWLIDFDFGGEIGETLLYPDGYKEDLRDGTRVGKEKEQIQKKDDWYALGQLIFDIFRIHVPEGDVEELKAWRMGEKWREITQEPSKKEKEELKSFLERISEKGWQVSPSTKFKNLLEDVANSTGLIPRTYKGATGTPVRRGSLREGGTCLKEE